MKASAARGGRCDREHQASLPQPWLCITSKLDRESSSCTDFSAQPACQTAQRARLTCSVQPCPPSAARHLPVVIWPQVHIIARLQHERPACSTTSSSTTSGSNSSSGRPSAVPGHSGAAALVVQQPVEDDATRR